MKQERKLRVLIVDDDAVCRQAAAHLLNESYDCSIDTAESATDALNLVNDRAFEWEEKGYDLILMDIYLPDINGDSLTDIMRKTESKTKSVPIVAVSGKVSESDKKWLQEMGITDLVLKPLTLEKIHQLVQKYWVELQEPQ